MDVTRLFDVRKIDQDGVVPLVSNDAAGIEFARLAPGDELEPSSREGQENNSIVVAGSLTYNTGLAQPEVPSGGWTVARPGERFGYRNAGSEPLHLLFFTPRLSPKKADIPATEIRQRIFPAPVASDQGTPVYQTRSSRGLLFSLTPGVQQKLDYADAVGIFVLDGRIMILVAGEKISIDAGEGLFVTKSVAEIVGVAGHSDVAVFQTRG